MNRVLDAAALDRRRFSAEQLDRLFQAVLVDDEVDAVTELPDRITLDHNPEQLIDCYRICRQLWREGVDRRAFAALIRKVGDDGDLDPTDRLAFKYARAKLKHLRFACALYGTEHRYPTVMDWMTTTLGHLQDAFKNGQRARVRREALLCRFFLSPLPQAVLRREQDRLRWTDTAGFRRYLAREIDTLDAVVRQPWVTGRTFHATRKIASRQVSFYDTLRTIAPSDEYLKMSRALAAINGLMGNLHDTLVERRIAGTQDYHRTPFVLPEDIRERLAGLVACYRASGLPRGDAECLQPLA